MNNVKYLGWIFFTLSFALNIFLVFNSSRQDSDIQSDSSSEEKRYPYLSKRIFQERPNDILLNFTKLREDLKKYILEPKLKIAFYFEYLPTGISIGINEKEDLELASLLKVPLVMAVYQKVREEKLSFNQALILQKEHLNKKWGNLWQRGEGGKVTLEEAVKLALIESDNTAKQLLLSTVGVPALTDVFDALDIPKKASEQDIILNVKNYSSIFKSLYFSSYLQKEDSNKILEYLTQTKFDEGIVLGVNKDVKIAHKIGVFENNEGKTEVISDCGIVYLSLRPFILCIMEQGTDNSLAQMHMKEISKMVYDYLSSAK